MDEAFQDLEQVYDRLERELEGLSPQCRGDGDCCRFETSKLRLFATTLETAYLLYRSGEPEAPPSLKACPYQQGNRCLARQGRPLGCRIYFCDPGVEAALPAIYERYHQEITALHKRHGLGYTYEELIRVLLREVDSR